MAIIDKKDKLAKLRELLSERIVYLDGAMGTNIQKFKPTEDTYRGNLFDDKEKYPQDLINNNEVLNLTAPDIITKIHKDFLITGGADIIETNTFSATTIAQNDFFVDDSQLKKEGKRKDQDFFDTVINDEELKRLIKDINVNAVKVARQAVKEAEEETGESKYIAGAIGPMPVTASLSPDVENPAFRQVNFDQLAFSYREQIETLIEEEVDIILIETVFDTLNAKAAIYAYKTLKNAQDDISDFPPIMISNTLISQGGRNLSNQNMEAFYVSIRHANPLAIGMNCALGANEMRSFAQDLSDLSDSYTIIYPNAGLPNPLSPTGYDQTPEIMAKNVEEYAKLGLLNIVGGCCGSTPEHIAAVKEICMKYPPRKID